MPWPANILDFHIITRFIRVLDNLEFHWYSLKTRNFPKIVCVALENWGFTWNFPFFSKIAFPDSKSYKCVFVTDFNHSNEKVRDDYNSNSAYALKLY